MIIQRVVENFSDEDESAACVGGERAREGGRDYPDRLMHKLYL